MKFSVVAVLAFAMVALHGSETGAAVVKREVPAELESLSKYFTELSSLLSSTTQELVQKLQAQELNTKAQAYLEDSRAQLKPLADSVQAQLKPLSDSIQAQLKPLSDSVQAQLKPLADSMQVQILELWNKVLDSAKALPASK
ncbi:type-4 ice-structuring protein LS-12-like [Polyodon spathula]|uniref:type-4 ice-structuring protein LS-12-like n=1 Tax=Polyodon spathula TaxID=7913 RepID=UPI001B7E4508|nr:type-4 ice-structuring protein LS-12-like [Polyodon spathula]